MSFVMIRIEVRVCSILWIQFGSIEYYDIIEESSILAALNMLSIVVMHVLTR